MRPTGRSAARTGGDGLRGAAATATGGVRAAERALEILAAFTRVETLELSLEDIAQAADLPKSTTHRLLDTLAQSGFVDAGRRHGTYRLGIRAAVVGEAAIRAQRPAKRLSDRLEQAAAETGESVALSVLDGDRIVILHKARSPAPLHWNPSPGTTLPVHCSAAGRVLLCETPEEEVRARLGGKDDLPPRTDHSITSTKVFLASLEETRRRGYAIDAEEAELGLRCIAVPVRGTSGRIRYSLGISGPASRMAALDVGATVATMQRIAREIRPFVDIATDETWPR